MMFKTKTALEHGAAPRRSSWHMVAFAFLIAATCVCVTLLFAPVRFAENDDVLFTLLLSGLYTGTPTPMTAFHNIFLSSAIASLYEAWPGLPWYPAILVAGVFCALTAFLVGFLSDSSQRTVHTGFAVLGLVTTSLFLLVMLQYTTVSGFAAAAGLYAIVVAVSWRGLCSGAILVIFAYLLRFEAAAFVTLVLSPAVLLGLYDRQRLWSGGAVLGAVLATAVVLELLGAARTAALAPEFVTFNAARGAINDSGLSALSETELPNGISELDLELLRKFFADGGQFSESQLADILDRMDERFLDLGFGDVSYVIQKVVENDFALAALVLAFVLTISASRGATRKGQLASFLILLSAMIYIETTAILKNRVAIAGLISVIASVLFYQPCFRAGIAGRASAFALVSVAVFMGQAARTPLQTEAEFRASFKEQAATFTDWPGKVVVFRAHLLVGAGHVFSDDFEGLREKVHFAGWLVRHPANDGVFESHLDLLNPDLALFYDPSVAEDVIGLLTRSLEENYGVVAKADIVSETASGRLVRFQRVLEPQTR